MASKNSVRVNILFNPEQAAYLRTFLDAGKELDSEAVKFLLKPFYDLPPDKKAGRPKGAKTHSK